MGELSRLPKRTSRVEKLPNKPEAEVMALLKLVLETAKLESKGPIPESLNAYADITAVTAELQPNFDATPANASNTEQFYKMLEASAA